MRISVLILLLFGFFAQRAEAHREEVYYLRGTIGEREVGLQLDESGDDCLARWFSFDTRRDRIFEGRILGGDWFELFAYSWADEKPPYDERECLLLKEVETDVWEGKLLQPDGSEEEVKLVRINIDELEHPFARAVKKYKISPFVALKTRDVKFAYGKTHRVNKGAEIQKVSDPRSGVEWFRIAPGNAGFAQVDSINDRLAAEHLSYIALKYSSPAGLDTAVFRLSYDVRFLNGQALSYAIDFHGLSFFGVERKESSIRNLSVATARELMLEDLFWFGGQPRQQFTEGDYRWTQYRYKEYGPRVFELLGRLYPRRFFPKKESDCPWNDPRTWYFADWYLQKKGLTLIGKPPPMKNKCKEAPVCIVPFRELKEFAVEGMEF